MDDLARKFAKRVENETAQMKARMRNPQVSLVDHVVTEQQHVDVDDPSVPSHSALTSQRRFDRKRDVQKLTR